MRLLRRHCFSSISANDLSLHPSLLGATADSNFIRESFDNIHLDLSKQAGKCRFADSGLGWKASGGGETFTLEKENITSAQWSRAARGFELKVLSRAGDVIQLDGFQQEVLEPRPPILESR